MGRDERLHKQLLVLPGSNLPWYESSARSVNAFSGSGTAEKISQKMLALAGANEYPSEDFSSQLVARSGEWRPCRDGTQCYEERRPSHRLAYLPCFIPGLGDHGTVGAGRKLYPREHGHCAQH